MPSTLAGRRDPFSLILGAFPSEGLHGTPWAVARQAPLSMGFPRQEYWSGLPFPPAGDLPDSGIEPVSPASPALTGGFIVIIFTAEPPQKAKERHHTEFNK